MGSDLGKGSERLGRCGGEARGTGVRCPKAGAKSRRQRLAGSRAAHTMAGLCLGAGGQPCPVLCFFSPKAEGSIPAACLPLPPGLSCKNRVWLAPQIHTKSPTLGQKSPCREESWATGAAIFSEGQHGGAQDLARMGCKIKALRAKTNTYIKTPVRGEEPVFMVTGRREDVAMARREIISAAEHFSMIRASRNKAGTTFGSAPTLPGQVTIRVRVPYRVVGLVVGPKGATIKRIQQQTNTYIITPSRDRDPVFEITGAPGNVERAREEIETHIAVRTGKILEYNNENDFLSSSPDSGMENRYSEAWRVHTPAPGCKPLSTFRQNSLGCIGDCSVDPVYETPRLNDQNDFNYGYLFPNYGVNKQDLYYGVPESGAPMWAGQENTNPVSVLFSKQQRSSSTGAIHPNSHRSPSSSIQEPNLSGLPRRSQGEPLQGFSKLGTTAAARTSVSSSRECMVCFESEVTAALVPCGHNLFCMECAVRICERTDPECPVCHAAATQAIRIFS
uniref:Mex-3 RNA binding family member A n=1 Tax=Anser cygnoides TaxID=8845 RepID=A0A8B9EU42_ANSCY